jgi:hypothetical protein
MHAYITVSSQGVILEDQDILILTSKEKFTM